MFDIGFWELILCAVIGLLVLGPERLPKAIRTVMRWVYTVRSIANQVKDDLEREIQIKELREEVDKAQAAGRKMKDELIDTHPSTVTSESKSVADQDEPVVAPSSVHESTSSSSEQHSEKTE